MLAQPVPKSLASPGLLACIATAKYADALPLYRQCQQFQRIGVELSRTTLARWMVCVGELVVPLINVLRDELVERLYLLMDETTVQVLKEPGKVPESKSQLWAQMPSLAGRIMATGSHSRAPWHRPCPQRARAPRRRRRWAGAHETPPRQG